MCRESRPSASTQGCYLVARSIVELIVTFVNLFNFTLARFDRRKTTPLTFAARVFRALSTNAALRRSIDDEMTHKVEAVLTLYNDGGDDDEPMRVTVPLQYTEAKT